MEGTIFIGIDVSQQTNTVHVMDGTGNRLWQRTFDNTLTGSQEIVRQVLETRHKHPAGFLSFGLEATGCYGDLIAMYLRETDLIPRFEKAVRLLNPKQVSQFKKSYAELPKTDGIDSFVIADSLRLGRIGLKGTVVEDKYLSLQKLTRSRFQVAKDLSREKNRYLQTLFLKFSTLAQDPPLSNLFGATALDLVNDFESVDEIAYTPLEELAEFLNQHGKGHFVDPEALAKEIQKAARSSYRLPKAIQNSVNQVLAMQAQTIRFYAQQLKDYDKLIEAQMTGIPNTLTSIKGIGPVYAAGILAEIGDVNRFKDQAALASFAGLSWSRHQSGKFEAEHTHLVHSGNRYLRYYLIEATNKVRKHDPELKQFYDRKYNETPKSKSKRALVLTARKFVRVVYALLRDNRIYIPRAD
ncbi:MAG: IS110 family transposase [Ruminococcaceae bacterium]|nr:IS110 family transposase [Oscillospiraceae bacterium]